MRKLLFALMLFAVAFMLTATTVAAFSITDVSVGSNTQQRGQTTTATVHIANDQNQSMTVTLSTTLGPDYRVTFSPATVTLAPGAATDVLMSIYVPLSANAGKTNIGTITATTNLNGITRIANIYMTAQNNLDVSKIYLETTDSSKSISTGGTFKAKPGDKVKVTITVRNEYSSDVRMRDITADVYNGDLDIDESLDFSDLRYGDKDTADFSFSVPSDINTDTYHVDVTLRGRDENGATHGGSYSFDIDVKRESHELTVQSATAMPSTVSCDRTVTVNLNVKNTGAHNENKMRVNLLSNDFLLNQDFAGISLDTDSIWRKTYSFQVPSTVKPGQYNILVSTYYDSSSDSGTAIIPVTVAACGNDNSNNNPNAQCTNYGQQFCVSGTSYQRCSATGTLSAVTSCGTGYQCQAGQCVQTAAPVSYPEGVSAPVYGSKSLFDSPAYLVLLVVAAVILLAFIIVLLVKFVF